MKWLPYDSWVIDSPLDVPALVAAMRELIEPTQWFRRPGRSDHTPLQGTINDQGFTSSRIIHYRNSFLPMLYGRFIPTPAGTSIRIRMTLHPLVMAFMAYWLGMTGLFALLGVVAGFTGQTWTMGIVAGCMFLFGLGMTYAGFWAEAGKAKAILSEVLLDLHKEAANDSVQSDELRAAPPSSPRA